MYVDRKEWYIKPDRQQEAIELIKKSHIPLDIPGCSWRLLRPRFGDDFNRRIVWEETFENDDERERALYAVRFGAPQNAEINKVLSQCHDVHAGRPETSTLFWILRDEKQQGDSGTWLMRIVLNTHPGMNWQAAEMMESRPLPRLPGLTFRLLVPLTGPVAMHQLVAEWGFASLDKYYEALMAFGQTEAGKEWQAQWAEVTQSRALHEMYRIVG